MPTQPTAFADDAARASRLAEVPNADWDTGMNMGGSNAPGIGINMLQGEISGQPQQFTLLDQFGDARQDQFSQSIGGLPYAAPSDYPLSGGTEGTQPKAAIRYGDPSANGDGSITLVADSALVSLAAGWVAGI